jgi:hypothetical protein
LASACVDCGTSLGFLRSFSGNRRCQDCAASAQQKSDRALAEYDATLQQLDPRGDLSAAALRLRDLEANAPDLGPTMLDHKLSFFRWYLDRALADEVIGEQEETVIAALNAELFADADRPAVTQVLAEYRTRMLIAMVNDGRLPTVDAGGLKLRRGEVVHLSERATLLKEVVEREFRAGSRGVSFRVAKGVTYRVGAIRGRMVEVGRSFQPADLGTLRVTSIRSVFTGERKSLEIPHAKLLDLNVYTDAIQFHVSGRQIPPALRVSNGPMVAAFVNAASQRAM